MKKIITFLKEYWYVVGAVVIAGIVFAYWFKSGVFLSSEAVEIPLTRYDGTTEISLSDFGTVPSKAPVFNVEVMSKENFDGFLSKIDSSFGGELYEDVYYYDLETQSVTYTPSSGITRMYFESPVDIGVGADDVITEDNIDEVLDQVYDKLFSGFPEFRILSATYGDEVVINLDYKVEDYDSYIASYYLEGYGAQIQLTQYGKLKSLNALMISDISFFENIPLAKEEELVENIQLNGFPKNISFEVTDEDFISLHPVEQELAFLVSMNINEIEFSWMFFDNEHKYAFPMYLCHGTGTAEIIQYDEKYGADTLMLVSPIDPKYMVVRYESDEEDEDTKEDSVGREEGDLFIGEPF